MGGLLQLATWSFWNGAQRDFVLSGKLTRKFLETVSELKKASEAAQCQHSTFPSSLTAPMYPSLLCLDLFSFSLPSSCSSTPPPPQLPIGLGETQNRKPEILADPFREKPVSRPGEPAVISSPCTRTELSNLTKDFPSSLQGLDEFAKEFDLIVGTYDPGYSNLFQLIYLLISESMATEWLHKACWKTLVEDFKKKTEWERQTRKNAEN